MKHRSDIANQKAAKMLYCTTCWVEFNSSEVRQRHLESKSHILNEIFQSKLSFLDQGNSCWASREKDSYKFCCQVCCIKTDTQEVLNIHLSSEKHVSKVRMREKILVENSAAIGMDLETDRSLSLKRKKNEQNGGMKHSVSAFGFSTETSCLQKSTCDDQMMSLSPTLYIDDSNERSKDSMASLTIDDENLGDQFEYKDSEDHQLCYQSDAKR